MLLLLMKVNTYGRVHVPVEALLIYRVPVETASELVEIARELAYDSRDTVETDNVPVETAREFVDMAKACAYSKRAPVDVAMV
jgi:hypothetical protein